MTSPIPGYAQGIPNDLVLGYICWYAVADPKITHQKLVETVTSLPLDPFIIPSPPRLGDAFKRACRNSERRGLAIPNSDHSANILVRSVSNTGKEIERHMVLEIVDTEGKVLEYHDCAQMVFDRTKNTLRVRKQTMPGTIDPIITASLTMFNHNFDDAAIHIEPQVIRRMLRDQLDYMHAVGVRKEGSVYFYPPKYLEKGEGLEALLNSFGNESTFHNLPLVDTTKQREMVKAALESEIHLEAIQTITELKRAVDSKEPLLVRQFTEYRDRLNSLRLRSSDYQSLINVEMTKVEVELDAMQANLETVLAEGLIKG